MVYASDQLHTDGFHQYTNLFSRTHVLDIPPHLPMQVRNIQRTHSSDTVGA
jgi:hypothetical protein